MKVYFDFIMIVPKKKNSVILSAIIIAIYVALISVVALGFFDIINLDETFLIVLISIGLVFTALIVLFYVIKIIIQKRKVLLEPRQRTQIPSGELQQMDSSSSIIIGDTSSQKSKSQTTKSIDLSKLLFIGAIENRNCGICKLGLRSGQTICYCPYCNSVFHRNHLEKWLESNNSCPICNYNLLEHFWNL